MFGENGIFSHQEGGIKSIWNFSATYSPMLLPNRDVSPQLVVNSIVEVAGTRKDQMNPQTLFPVKEIFHFGQFLKAFRKTSLMNMSDMMYDLPYIA